MTLSSGDKSVVSNIRQDLKEAVTGFTDDQIARTWKEFSQSEDYNAKDRMTRFLEWLRYS